MTVKADVEVLKKQVETIKESFDDNVTQNRDDFKEYQYLAGKAVNGTGTALDEFVSLAIKIVLQGTNSSLPPMVKDLRVIALAT